ncbi:deoxyribodipyrimidine photo-lyase [Myroides sp. WP-1]|uniref:cryptochrome/photolyase family protein n=1 Tax=Myroides sp. WP-1 TaxID=2759944 RepID=UPI0015FE15B1|nr:deoxyribodipyrimidine photo-lyase [Myroides sp. WP-1]MBB1139732.1 deoxyribodipyrimidine photo-lyase [Myroides sp. WP-1]
MEEIVLFWFRRDMRLHDNVGLYHAIQTGKKVLPVFIFDTAILDQFPSKDDRRIQYIYQALTQMNEALCPLNSQVFVYHGQVIPTFDYLLQKYPISAVYTNTDYEPQARKRDSAVQALVAQKNIAFYSFKDQVIFETNELLKSDNTPYKVYTPYAKLWRSKLTEQHLIDWTITLNEGNFVPKDKEVALPSLIKMGYNTPTIKNVKPPVFDRSIIQNYTENRDYPALDATTHLGMAIRFGTVSIRTCVKQAIRDNDTWLSQLIWREFFMSILYHYPSSARACFKSEYENIKWRNNEVEFEAWCKGETGYPFVDAGMRELNQTGYMHNRVRMIVASFLVKHLLIDWRWGEAYFAQKLNDYDLAANVGNWQWAAGCGCDAAPYFRIFNPSEQQKKFDKDEQYIKRWIPEYGTEDYIAPLVEHKFARERALTAFKQALK